MKQTGWDDNERRALNISDQWQRIGCRLQGFRLARSWWLWLTFRPRPKILLPSAFPWLSLFSLRARYIHSHHTLHVKLFLPNLSLVNLSKRLCQSLIHQLTIINHHTVELLTAQSIKADLVKSKTIVKQ